MDFKHSLTDLEKAFLIAHKNDYTPEIRQFILINEGNWLYQLRNETEGRMHIFRYTDTRNNFPHAILNERCKKLFSYTVSNDIVPFIKHMNRSILNIDNLCSDMSYDEYLSFMSYVLFYIFPKKMEACELVKYLADDGIGLLSFTHITLFINSIQELIDNASKGINTENCGKEIARNLVLLYRIQIGEEISFAKATMGFYSYIATKCGEYFLSNVKKEVESLMNGEEYLPVVSNTPTQLNIHDFDKVEASWGENVFNNYTSESSRDLILFGANINNKRIVRSDARIILDIDEKEIQNYVRCESVDFQIPENDLMYLKENYPKNGLLLIKTPRDSRYIFSIATENGDSPFLLFKPKESLGEVWGISCKMNRDTKRRSVFHTKANGEYILTSKGL